MSPNPDGIEAGLIFDLPKTARAASRLADLDAFLREVALGFHWQLLDEIGTGVYFVDHERRIRYWSRGAELITGYSAETVLGRCCRDNILRHVDRTGLGLCENYCPLEATIRDGRPRSASVFLHHRRGHRVPVHIRGVPIRDFEGRIIGAFETFADTTEHSADLQRILELEMAALVDPLTELPNRRFFDTELRNRLRGLQESGTSFGLLILDIDGFKSINDEAGHPAGDEALSLVGRTLAHACRAHDFAARLAGDEFAALCTAAGVYDLQERGELFRQLVASSPLDHDGRVLAITVSVGGSMARADDTAATLLARADRLLYQSKVNGRNRITVERAAHENAGDS